MTAVLRTLIGLLPFALVGVGLFLWFGTGQALVGVGVLAFIDLTLIGGG